MAIALPPPVQPQQASVEQLASEPGFVIDYKSFKLHISGGGAIEAEALRTAIVAAPNMSDAVRTVARAYSLGGYPAAMTFYAWAGGSSRDIYIHIVPGRVTQVIAPAALQAYFKDLPQTPLTASDLETDRVLADLYTDRTGQQYAPVFKPQGGDTVSLDFGEPMPAGRQTHVLGNFNNYGNRYAGPYFTSLALQQDFSTGDEVQLSGTVKSGPDWNDYGKTEGSSYTGLSAGWTRVTSRGVFGIDGRYDRYDQLIENFPLEGRGNNVGLSWLYPLYSDYDQRLLLQARLDHDEQNIKISDTGALADDNIVRNLLRVLGLLPSAPDAVSAELLDENYESTEIDLSYLARWQVLDRSLQLQSSLMARKGLGPQRSSRTIANQAYFLWRPALSLRYSLVDGWAVVADASAQFSGNTVPQQEQFVIGGPATARAYRSGAGVGDEGHNLRLSVEWLGPGESWLRRQSLKANVFVEQASSRRSERLEDAGKAKVSVADVGASLEMRVLSWLSGSVSASDGFHAQGKDNSADGLDEKTVYFQITARY